MNSPPWLLVLGRFYGAMLKMHHLISYRYMDSIYPHTWFPVTVLNLFRFIQQLQIFERMGSWDVRDGKDLRVPPSRGNFKLQENSTHQAKGPWIILTDLILGSYIPNLLIWKRALSGMVRLYKTSFIHVILISETVLPTCNFTHQINRWLILLWVEYFCDLKKHKKIVEQMRFRDIEMATTSHLLCAYYETECLQLVPALEGLWQSVSGRDTGPRVRRLEF